MSATSALALIEAFSNYKKSADAAEKNLCFQLDDLSKKLAADPALREELPIISPSLWSDVSRLWIAALSGFETDVSLDVILSLSRFTRNLVAGVPKSQEIAFKNEPHIRGILHHLSAFSMIGNSDLYPLTRMLVQTLSNFVTLNGYVASLIWTLYTTLPEDQNIVMRLLVSPDIRTVISILVLILNCMKADESGLEKLISPIGLRILILLLDRTEAWVDQDVEGSEENEAFTLTYRIFEALLDQGYGPPLHDSLSIEDEPVTPHQTTFLKIIDSYVRHQDERITTQEFGYSFLARAFLDLGSYYQRAIRLSLGLEPAENLDSMQADGPGDLKALDARLPKVSEALILVSQSLTTICLKDAESPAANICYHTVAKATQAGGFIENLVETLRLLDIFLPRIVFGAAAARPGIHTSGRQTDTSGFAYVKRDLVRFLGVICQERKDIQDRIRECGGIPVVMNLCVIDERNPYLQEHALFTLRNILYRNPENQQIVEAMKLEQG